MKKRILRAAALLLSLACLVLPAAAAGEAVARTVQTMLQEREGRTR